MLECQQELLADCVKWVQDREKNLEKQHEKINSIGEHDTDGDTLATVIQLAEDATEVNISIPNTMCC